MGEEHAREHGLSVDQGVAEVMMTDRGKLLMHRDQRHRAEKAQRREPFAMGNDDDGMSDADRQISELAAEHKRKNPKLTDAQAVDHVATRTARGRALLQEAKQASVAKNA